MFRNALAGAIVGTAALATVFITPADAQRDRVQAGSLECSLSSGIGLIVGSQRNIACNFKPDGGPPEAYEGTMTRIGLTRATGPRCVALVGPFQSGKTTLLEAILARTGAIPRQGSVEAGNTVGDASKEARHHHMSVELTVATTDFMGDSYTFLDCPGSVEFVHDMRAVLPAIDAAVVVCEMDEKKIPQLQLILRELEDKKIPRILFVNKIDKADAGVHDVLKLLQPASRTKLIMRQIPTFSGDIISGFVDLALERAFVYKEHAASEVVPLEGDAADLEKTARFSMLETLADHDDELMEQLLEDIQPPRDKVFDDLTARIARGSGLSGFDGHGGARQRRAAAA
jgi:elongation factor G